MSHFTVLVIGDNPEQQLAPYQENNMGDCPEQYLEFYDEEDNLLEEYKTGTSEVVVMPDGSFVSKYDERFQKRRVKGELVPAELNIEDYTVREVPFTERYATFEEFAHDYHGFKQRDPKKNRYGYWENPNAKWDWYQLGGRWTGFFKLKSDKEGGSVLGQPGVFGNEAEPHTADAARKRQIDFDAMEAEARADAEYMADKVRKAVLNITPPKPWKEFMMDYDDVKVAREAYHAHPWLIAFKTSDIELWFEDPVAMFADLDKYIARRVAAAYSTYAILNHGQWISRGDMGWFGISSNEISEDEWLARVREMIRALPNDTLLSVYDCHI